MFKISTTAAVAALLALSWAAPAQAATVRAWVSGHGSDVASCGAPATPCRTLQYTHDNIVAANGEIDILDPAGYGTLNITKGISIVNDGVGTAGVQSNSGDAITVNAPGASVYLRGLNIDGVQFGGRNGIEFEAGSILTVVNCVVRHFSNDGLLIDPTAGNVSVAVSDSSFSENLVVGVAYQPLGGSANTAAVFDRIRANDNGQDGIGFNSSAATGRVAFSISNSDASENVHYGVVAQGGTADSIIEVDTSTMESNGQSGLAGLGSATVHVAKSMLDFNGQFGMDNETSAPGSFASSGDNHATANSSGPVGGTTPGTEALH